MPNFFYGPNPPTMPIQGDFWVDQDNHTLTIFSGSAWVAPRLQSTVDSEPIRINSRNYANATGDTIGFQSKPRQNTAKTDNSVFGAQIEPSLSNGVGLAGASGAFIGLSIAPYLRGTSAGTIGADVRALNIELVTDDAGTRDITGYVTAIRIRKVFSAGTVTGEQSVMRVEIPEAQTNSETYTTFFELTSTITNVWHDTGSVSTEAGYIKVIVNGNDRWLQLYSTGP